MKTGCNFRHVRHEHFYTMTMASNWGDGGGGGGVCVGGLDRNDVSLPSHRWTNGWQPLKNIVTNGWLTKKTIGPNG